MVVFIFYYESMELVRYFYNSNGLFSCFLIYAILFLFFIYCKILINYKMRVSKGLRLNASRLTPHLMGTKTHNLMPSPLKTLLALTTKIQTPCLNLLQVQQLNPNLVITSILTSLKSLVT